MTELPQPDKLTTNKGEKTQFYIQLVCKQHFVGPFGLLESSGQPGPKIKNSPILLKDPTFKGGFKIFFGRTNQIHISISELC